MLTERDIAVITSAPVIARTELFLNSEGRWVFQPKRATPPRPPAKKAAPHRATA